MEDTISKHMSRSGLAIRRFVVTMALVGGIAAVATAAPSFPAKERLNTLFIAPPHGHNGDRAAECVLMESLSNVRLSAAPAPYNAGSQIADVDGMFGADERWVALRKAELLRQLRRPYDAVIVAVKVEDPELQEVLARYVSDGGVLVWMIGDALPAGVASGLKAAPAVASPLAALGLEQAGFQAPAKAAFPTNGMAVLHPGVAAYGIVGKGRVVSIAAGGSLFPARFAAGIDGDWLWAQVFERLVGFAVRGTVPPAVTVQAVLAETNASSVVEQKVRATLTGPAGTVLALRQSDMRGTVRELTKAVVLTTEPVTVEVMVDATLGAPSMIEAIPNAGAVASGLTFLKLPAPLALDLYTIRQGNLPDFRTESVLQLEPKSGLGKATLHWTVLDWARKTVAHRAEPVELKAGEAIERTFDYTLADPDPRAYISWLRVDVTDPKGKLLAHGETPLYRYRPYDMTEQLLMGTWHTDTVSGRPGISDTFATYLRECGFNAVFNYADRDVIERHNFRQYMEHQGTTRVGVGHAAPFGGAIEGYAERYQSEGRGRAGIGKGFGEPGYRGPWPSAALNLFSMGEETGFGRWSEAYPWRDKEEAPENCNKWFRHYLQQLYGNDLAMLNAAWGKAFADWSEIKVWRKYAEPFGWMWMPPPQELEENLTPYVDTHAFHEWYVAEFCQNYMKGYVTGNPVATWTMSYDFTFLQFPPAPMTHFWHAVAPEGVALWHNYVRSRTPGPGNPFHLNWMFFEDEAMNNQFLQLGLASGCTYLFNWGEMFNGDLTPSRKTLAVARTMKQAERPEALLRKMTPHTDARVGIFTLDSRWLLVRGRYGFFMQRNGPHDLTMGKGPYQAPGASYIKPPELALYRALSTSGYAPKFVKPDQFKDCKVLFLPYVEAVDQKTAAAVRQFVEDGGTLVVFPTIAQYDEGGKPYPAYPGAGFDKLLGFTAAPDWLMGRSQVEFPGENAAKKAFEEAWLLGERGNKPATNAPAVQPPLFFNLGMRIGGHPCHYMPEGRQRLENLAKDVVVIGRHEDGNPLLTYRKVGKGAAVCFNVLLTGESGLAEPTTEATETFRQVIDQLVRRCGVTPDFEIENTRAYGEGLSDFVTMQYDLPGTTARVLAIFGDYRGRRADARLRLRPPFTAAYDALAGERMVSIFNPARQALETVLTVEPGFWRLLVLTDGPLATPTLVGSKSAQMGETAAFTVGPDPKVTRYGRVEVLGPDGQPLAHHSGSVVLKTEEPLVLRLRLDEPLTDTAGKEQSWTVRWRDAVSGQTAEAKLEVRASKDAAALAKAALPAEAESLSRQLMRRGPALTDAEFLGMLVQLRERHLDSESVDKRRYSYYSYELGESRHRAMQMLATTDWTARVGALAGFLAAGERLFLVGEDLGVDPASGVTTTPGRRPRILEALQQLAQGKDARVWTLSGKPYLRIVRVGKGMVVLDRRSPDGAGNSNLHLAAFQRAWREEMIACGLADGGLTRLLPVDEEPLEQWFVGK